MSHPKPVVVGRPWRFETDPTLSFRHPEIADFQKTWQILSSDGGIPHRSALDPANLKPILPHMFIIGVIYEPEPRFRYRLIGTNIVTTLGRDATGQWLEDLHATTPEVVENLKQAVAEERPLRTFGSVSWIDKEFLDFETGVFPFLTDGDRVEQLIGATIYSPARQA